MLPAVRSEKSSQSGLVGPEEACKEWNRWLKQLCKKVLWTISLLVICCITIIWTVCNFAGVTPDQIETYFGRLACDISGSLYLYSFNPQDIPGKRSEPGAKQTVLSAPFKDSKWVKVLRLSTTCS